MSNSDHDRDHDVQQDTFQRRLRHVTFIQIRNLTPSPTPDDIHFSLSPKRSRRISTNSVNTPQLDDPTSKFDNGDRRGRRRTQSRSAESNTTSTCTTAPTVKPSNRMRASSIVSPLGASTTSISNTQAPSTLTTVSSPSLFFDYSQRKLEKLVQSRLVETFISITVPDPRDVFLPTPTTQRTRAESAPRACSSSDFTPVNINPACSARRLSKMSHSNSAEASKATSLPRGEASLSSRSSISIRKVTLPVKTSGASLTPRLLPKTHKSSASVPPKLTASYLPSPPASPEHPPFRAVPNYISPIHRPSTNPSFVIDAWSTFEFSPWTDLSADTINVQLWAKTCRHSIDEAPLEGKGKQREKSVIIHDDLTAEWSVLDQWTVSLADLVPVTSEHEAHPSRLPSNTLVVSLSTSTQTFYLPTCPLFSAYSHPRSPSPAAYNSDSEAEIRTFGHSTNKATPTTHTPPEQPRSPLSRKAARTASSQDLLKLVTLRSCIVDHEESLADVMRQIHKALDNDVVAILKREASEREARIEDRQSEAKGISERACHLREAIASRRKKITQRREFLAAARSIQDREQANLEKTAVEVTEEKQCLEALQKRLPPIRAFLISTLSRLYPIELLSPSELLFTILCVPLPIPLNANEPAPPLSLASHKEVTEDVVAIALGFAAQLVQLLAIYMGKGLIYPITCIGSRSLIRDNISAMVGPRMFPLFSRGVDTYRFEYGVFLLNKDIEMLMADRDLRALDMRHTLPNLKNLLLTVTDGESPSVGKHKVLDSPILDGLATPRPAVVLTPDSPKGEQSRRELSVNVEANTATTDSGGRTPTASDGGTFYRYSKISIGFPPLPGFLRSRNGSSIGRVRMRLDPEEAEDGVVSGLSCQRVGKDEEDRGVVVEDAEHDAIS